MARREYNFWVDILASRSRTVYVGMTNGLTRRTTEHQSLIPGSFTACYGIFRLVYFEHHQYVLNAIAREKQLKKWTRAQKVALIRELNPTWEDLSQQFGQTVVPTLHGTQIPFGNGNQRNKDEDESAADRLVAAPRDKQQIPFGNDNQRAEPASSGCARHDARGAGE